MNKSIQKIAFAALLCAITTAASAQTYRMHLAKPGLAIAGDSGNPSTPSGPSNTPKAGFLVFTMSFPEQIEPVVDVGVNPTWENNGFQLTCPANALTPNGSGRFFDQTVPGANVSMAAASVSICVPASSTEAAPQNVMASVRYISAGRPPRVVSTIRSQAAGFTANGKQWVLTGYHSRAPQVLSRRIQLQEVNGIPAAQEISYVASSVGSELPTTVDVGVN